MAFRLASFLPLVLLPLQLLLLLPGGAWSATFTLLNNCEHVIWPGLLSSAGTAPLSTTGFSLDKGESKTVSAPTNWSGRLWARTLCTTDPSTGRLSCATADCGSGKLECSGRGAAPPATLAEFTLAGSGGMDFYDVSLVDGYNLPMLVVPQGGSGGNCTSTGCAVDINGSCPSELRVLAEGGGGGGGEAVACRSACDKFGTAEYCCSGAYANPNTCRPTAYSKVFKNACPRAYSYAYDDGTSTFTCAGANYVVTFCPTTSSQKSAGASPGADGGNSHAVPLTGNPMVFLGGDLMNAASPSPTASPLAPLLVALVLVMPLRLLGDLF